MPDTAHFKLSLVPRTALKSGSSYRRVLMMIQCNR